MSRVIQTRHGAMRVDYTVPDVCSLSLEQCLTVLRSNDSNGCYTQADAIAENGQPWTLIDARLQVLVELQDYDRPDAVEWHDTERVDALRAQLQTR